MERHEIPESIRKSLADPQAKVSHARQQLTELRAALYLAEHTARAAEQVALAAVNTAIAAMELPAKPYALTADGKFFILEEP